MFKSDDNPTGPNSVSEPIIIEQEKVVEMSNKK